MARRRQAEEGLFARELSESEVRSAREATTARDRGLGKDARERQTARLYKHEITC
jgi:hypothetical protein